MRALKDKEVWVNMIAGSNHINSALLLSGTRFGVPTSCYYMFQEDTELLESQHLKKQITDSVVKQLLEQWHELPVFHLLPQFLDRLEQELNNNNNKIYEYQLREIVKEFRIEIVKLRRYLSRIKEGKKNNVYEPTPLLQEMIDMRKKIEDENVQNASEWRKWVINEGMLWEIDLDTNKVTQVRK